MRHNQRGIFILLYFTIIAIYVIAVMKPVRTAGSMVQIASEMLREPGPLQLFAANGDILYRGIHGPILNDVEDRIEYTWFKVLDWGDTATISASVYKNVLNELGSLVRRKNPPAVWANSKWNYVYNPVGESRFSDLLPESNKQRSTDSSVYTLSRQQDESHTSFKYIIKPDKLLILLQRGYFNVAEKKGNYTTVDFFEPIAEAPSEPNGSRAQTISARVYVDDSLNILIEPCGFAF